MSCSSTNKPVRNTFRVRRRRNLSSGKLDNIRVYYAQKKNIQHGRFILRILSAHYYYHHGKRRTATRNISEYHVCLSDRLLSHMYLLRLSQRRRGYNYSTSSVDSIVCFGANMVMSPGLTNASRLFLNVSDPHPTAIRIQEKQENRHTRCTASRGAGEASGPALGSIQCSKGKASKDPRWQ